MKTIALIFSLGVSLALSTSFAADKEKPVVPDKAVAPENAVAEDKEKPVVSDKENPNNVAAADALFLRRAADAGMTEVELGKLAEKNGQRDDVKTFGSHMVKDRGKANENLKSVAAKMKATLPDKIRPKSLFRIDKMSKLSGAAFDTAYVGAMVGDHERAVAAFEKARAEVSNADLKKFMDDTLPVLKEHLEMAKKMQSAK